MYSRRPASTPTKVSAGRVVQRGCEPKAINPLQGEKRERGRFLVTRDIGTKRDLFNNPQMALPPAAQPLSPAKLLVAQIGSSLGAERSPGPGKAQHQGQQGSHPGRPQQRHRQEDPFYLHQPGDQEIGGEGPERASDECCQRAEQAVLDEESTSYRAAGRPQHFQHDRIVDTSVVTRGDRSAEHQRARGKGNKCGQTDSVTDRTDQAIERGKRLTNLDRRDVGEPIGDGAHQFFLLGGRQINGGEVGLRRSLERAGGEDQGEVDAQPLERKLAMTAVISRPSRLTLSVSPTSRPMPRARSASKETSGGPL